MRKFQDKLEPLAHAAPPCGFHLAIARAGLYRLRKKPNTAILWRRSRSFASLCRNSTRGSFRFTITRAVILSPLFGRRTPVFHSVHRLPRTTRVLRPKSGLRMTVLIIGRSASGFCPSWAAARLSRLTTTVLERFSAYPFTPTLPAPTAPPGRFHDPLPSLHFAVAVQHRREFPHIVNQ